MSEAIEITLVPPNPPRGPWPWWWMPRESDLGDAFALWLQRHRPDLRITRERAIAPRCRPDFFGVSADGRAVTIFDLKMGAEIPALRQITRYVEATVATGAYDIVQAVLVARGFHLRGSPIPPWLDLLPVVVSFEGVG